MMDQEILRKIDHEIEMARGRLSADTIRYVNIKSVRGEPLPGAPFGEGPRRMLSEFMSIAKEDGFFVTDYGVGVVSASMTSAKPDVGIWVHGDVVPEGDGWKFSPYDAVEYDGCIIGRGAGDNKGQLAAIYNLFRIFKSLKISLGYNPAIYLGSNEETGMRDMIGVKGNPDAKGFVNVCRAPRLSLVPDGAFPVGYGGKGALTIRLRSKTPLLSLCFTAGEDSSPGLAEAILAENTRIIGELPECTLSTDGKRVSAYTPPRHGANPDPKGNMITKLSSALIASVDIPKADTAILATLRDLSLDVCGEAMGIATKSPTMGNLTVFSKFVRCENGIPEIGLNIRYPIGITYEEIVASAQAFAEARGYEISAAERGVDAYMLDKDSDTVGLLCEIVNSVTGGTSAPYTMSGGTYAHCLPNAYVFGSSSNLPPANFPAGHGGVHGVDEAVSLDRLTRMMKIYARALLQLKELL